MAEAGLKVASSTQMQARTQSTLTHARTHTNIHTQIAEAYEVLKDDEKRAAYDRGDDLQVGGGGGGFHPGGFNFGGGSFTFTFNA